MEGILGYYEVNTRSQRQLGTVYGSLDKVEDGSCLLAFGSLSKQCWMWKKAYTNVKRRWWVYLYRSVGSEKRESKTHFEKSMFSLRKNTKKLKKNHCSESADNRYSCPLG